MEERMDERTKELAQGSIPRMLMRLSIPAMTGMIIEAFYNVVDRMFVGRAHVGMAGPEGLAGLTICFPFMTIVMAFTLMLSGGGAARISLALGKGETDTAEDIVTTGFFLSIVFGMGITVIGLAFLKPLLILFGADEITLPYAQAYMRIILYGTVPNLITFSMNRYIVAQGRAMFAMVTLIIGCGINFVLDPLFIYVFLWGVEGAAWATIIAWAVTAVWVVSFFLRKKGILRLRVIGVRIRWGNILSILSIGIAPFSMQIVTSLTGSILNNSLRIYGGAMAISAMGAIQSVLQFFQMPLYGLNQGSQPIVGFNYGAQNYRRVRETLRINLFVATVIGILGFTCAMSIPGSLVGIFGNDPEMLAVGSRSMRIFMALFPFIGFFILGSNFFSVTGRPQYSMLITLSKQAMLIPGLLILPRIMGIDGVFTAGPVADGVAITLGIVLVSREWKRLKSLE
jgi:putative MATE family efflux protein